MAASDARIFPLKNTAYRVTFPILDADGDLVTGATGLDSEVSQDGGAFADCTNEATEIATNSGMYYLDLTSGEMNGDTVALIVKTSSSGAKTTAMVFYPVETGDIDVDVTAFGGTAATTSGGRPEVNTTHAAGTAWGSGAITAASIAADAITAAKIADNAIDAGALAADCITAAKIADGAIDAATFAAGAINAAAIASDAITDAKVASDVTIASVTGAVGSVTGNVGGNVTGSVGSIATGGIAAASFAAGAIDSAAIAANAIGASELAADAVAEIQSGLSTLDAAGVRTAVGLASANLDTQLSTIDDFLDTEVAAILAAVDTEVAAIKAKTDNLPADPADASDIAASFSSIASTLATIAAYLDTEVAAIKAKTDNLPSDPADESSLQAAIAALNNLSAAQVLTQVNAALDTAISELGVATPTATPTLRTGLMLLYMALRNKIDVDKTALTKEVHNNAGTVIATKSLSDDGTTYSEAKMT